MSEKLLESALFIRVGRVTENKHFFFRPHMIISPTQTLDRLPVARTVFSENWSNHVVTYTIGKVMKKARKKYFFKNYILNGFFYKK